MNSLSKTHYIFQAGFAVQWVPPSTMDPAHWEVLGPDYPINEMIFSLHKALALCYKEMEKFLGEDFNSEDFFFTISH